MLDRLREIPLHQMEALCLVTTTAVALLDWFTGPDLQVLALYLVPVVAATWYIGPRAGWAFAGGTAALTLAIALLTPSGHSPLTATANAVFRLVILVVAVWVVSAERRHLATITAIADIDPLTKALNRRAFTAAVLPRLSGSDETPGALLYLDVDGLKTLNDERGHEAGDRHLQELAAIIRNAIRSEDHFARLGGDEFAVFLTGQDVETAHAVAARLVAVCGNQASPIRLSIGVAPADAPGDSETKSLDPLLHRADVVMYDAKRSGGGVRVERRRSPQTPRGV